MNSTSPVYLLLEGGSQNLIPSPSAITTVVEGAYPDSFTLSRSSALGQGDCWSVSIPAGRNLEIAVPIIFDADSSALTASCFCWSVPTGAVLYMSLDTQGNSVARTFCTEHPSLRFSISLPVPASSKSAVVNFRITNPLGNELRVNLAYLCVERGSFASTPIPPGATRGAELLDCDDPLKTYWGSSEGALLFTFNPLYEFSDGDAPNDGCLFGAFSADGLIGIEIFLTKRVGKIGLRVFNLTGMQQLSTESRPYKGTVTGIGLLWYADTLELIVDGVSVGELVHSLKDLSILTKVRIGNHPLYDERAANIGLRAMRVIHQNLGLWEIQAIFAEIDRERYWYFVPILDRFLEAEAQRWPRELIGPLFKIPSRWQASPPLWSQDGKSLDEGIFRDDVSSYLDAAGIPSFSEAENAAGKTDLIVLLGKGLKVRLEFKIWGRHDYADVPMKPLKYMSDDEELGIVVMLNPNKSSINWPYVRNVSRGPATCIRTVETPFSDFTGAFHFTSEHSIGEKRFQILHLVFNLHTPVARSGIIQAIEAKAKRL